MCITQSRRRRSYGLNLAAYTAAYAKEAPERTTGTTDASASASRPIDAAAAAASEQLVDPRDGTAFTAVAFPDAGADADADFAFDVLDVDVTPGGAACDYASGSLAGVVSDAEQQQQQQLGETPSSSVAASRGEEFRPLEGQYVQGVFIPPAKPAPKRTRKPQKAGLTAKLNVRHFIQHNYHDHADDVPTEAEERAEPAAEQIEEAIRLHNMTGGSAKAKATASASSNSAAAKISFPRKLHHILDQIERDGYAHVISWLPHGRAFAIHQPKDFIATVMPRYFQQTKVTSFQRQLNLYGFQRLTRGRDNGGYYHEYFLRGMPFLTKSIARTRVKGTRFKGASNPEAEPNFYAMRPVGLGGVGQRQVQAPEPAPMPAPAPAPMYHQQQQPTVVVDSIGFTRRVSEGSDTSSLSCQSAYNNHHHNHNKNHNQGYYTLQRANPIGDQCASSHREVPRQVVVPAQHLTQYHQYQQISSAAIAAAAATSASNVASMRSTGTTAAGMDMASYAHYQPKMSPAVPSPTTASGAAAAPLPQQQQQQQQQAKKPASICDLWKDSPDAFEPNPFLQSPPASPTRQAVAHTAKATTIGAAADGADPLLDLVESWARDDTMDDLVEQAIENDLDFGYLLEIIAQE